MTVQEVIAKKRDKQALSREEMAFFIQGVSKGEVGEEQAAAWLMAAYINGLSEQELVDLTYEMAASGKTMQLDSLKGIPVDKHSTGGVGDKLTLVVAPLAAAAGVPIAKMSGRGLGHTGGTIDKLEAIAGLKTELSDHQFLEQVANIGLALVSQSSDLVPADKILYSLRNRTATVDSLPLIASSIMSKKLAAGCPKILLDVTVGSGAFMKSAESARELAETMVKIGNMSGRETIALLTNMEEPLGFAVGNALEVAEAIATLQNEGPDDLTELALTFVSEMIELSGLGQAKEQRERLLTLLKNGEALAKFRAMVAAQGGDTRMIDNPSLLPKACVVIPVIAPKDGYISYVDALGIGEAAVLLGAGRLQKEDQLDFAAGIVLCGKTGDYVAKGKPLCYIHASSAEKAELVLPRILDCFGITKDKTSAHELILGRVS